MGKYFGTDGYRGRVGEVLTPHHAYMIGRFLGWYLQKSHEGQSDDVGHARVTMGKDTRRSCDMLACGLTAGLTASGVDVYWLGVITTPGVAFAVKAHGFDAGVMISASHNPFDDNGIKLLDGKGEKLGDETADLIEVYIDRGLDDLPLATGGDVGAVTDATWICDHYAQHLMTHTTHAYDHCRVGLDCANGAAFALAKQIFEKLGACVYAIGDSPNGVNINRGVGSTHPEALQDLVRSQGLDVGFAFDGDGDRCLAVDGEGCEIGGDHILYILGCHLLQHHALAESCVVSTVMSNMGLGKALAEEGISLVQTSVGDRFVYERMVQDGYDLGGEQSGHIIVRKYATTGDGILTALLLMEVMAERGQSLATLSAKLKMYPQVCLNVAVKDKDGVLNHPYVQAKQQEITQKLEGRGRLLLRKSGTEPVVRVMVEAEDEALCQAMAEEMRDTISQLCI